MTERTRYPIHIERTEVVPDWVGVGWTYCGEHPALPGFVILEWREGRKPVAPFRSSTVISERQHIACAVAALDGEAA